jgi:PAS domain-containing protein
VVTIVLEIGLTALLCWLLPRFPLGNFPIPYVILIMTVAYFFGEGPAALAFVIGILAFTHYFVSSHGLGWPPAEDVQGWAKLAAFLLGTSVVGFATALIRRSTRATKRLAEQLLEAKNMAERRQSELEAILSSMVNAVIVVDTEREVVFANEAAHGLTSHRRELGTTIEEWIQDVNLREMDGTPIELYGHPLMAALRGETVREKLMLIDGEDGPDTVISATSSPVRNGRGEVIGAAVTVRNITLQRRMQEDMARQGSLLDAFMHNVPIGLTLRGADTRCIMANQALADINQVPLEEMLGKRAREYLPLRLAMDIESATEQVISTGRPVVWRDKSVMFAGTTERFFDVEFIPVLTSNGDLIGVGSVVVPTTDQVIARRELERIYERERRIAEVLQTNLLSPVPRRIGAFEFDTLYRAANLEARVGGDFYDVFRISDDKVGIVLGDVSGKGLTAAVHVAATKYAIRSRAYEQDSPAIAMEQVNETLFRETEIEGFITIFVGILDIRSGTLRYANCGHEPVILWSAAEGQATLLGPTGPIIGAVTGIRCEEASITLNSGDELLLATDGLFEIKCDNAFLEVGGLLEIYTDLKRSGVMSAAGLVKRVVDHCGGEVRDDVAVLRVTAAAEDVPPTSTWPSSL